MNADVRVSEDPAGAAAEILAGARGHVAITGGSTPRVAYERVAEIERARLHLLAAREHEELLREARGALGRGEAGDAARLEKNLMPKVQLDHIIKERYPTFVDALRDLDDALSRLFRRHRFHRSIHILPHPFP